MTKITSVIQLIICIVLLVCCKKEEPHEDYRTWGYYPIQNIHKHKLTEFGIGRAKAVWDSIRPSLKVDSTVRGVEYSGRLSESFKEPLFIWLSFDYDSTYQRPSNLTFHMIPPTHDVPSSYMYFGDSMVPCMDKFVKGEYKDTVDIVIDRGLRRLIKGEGIRIDTDRGKTIKLSPYQINSLKMSISAYEALSLLYHNKMKDS